MTRSTRSRLVSAAFQLFAEKGYDRTSVDDIASMAGVGRTTFFRHFATKEDVVFPDHNVLLPLVEARLATATAATFDVALREAARIVLDHYVSEGDAARTRYQLTRSVTALRDRELVTVHRYFRIFNSHARKWLGDGPETALRGELLASAVVTAHNYVLRSWLRGETSEIDADFDRAMECALGRGADAPRGRTVVIQAGGSDVDRVLAEVREAMAGF